MVAQQRGLKCGVQTGSGNSSSQSADKLRSMSDEVICASATIAENGRRERPTHTLKRQKTRSHLQCYGTVSFENSKRDKRDL